MIPPPAGGGATKSRKSYVYLLRSKKDGSAYFGWTTNLLRRLAEHNDGLSEFTQRKRPWTLLGFESYGSPEEAKARERALKRSSRMLGFFKKRVLSRAAIGRSRQVRG